MTPKRMAQGTLACAIGLLIAGAAHAAGDQPSEGGDKEPITCANCVGGECSSLNCARSCSTKRNPASSNPLLTLMLSRIDPDLGFEFWNSLRNPDVFEVELCAGRPPSMRRVCALS